MRDTKKVTPRSSRFNMTPTVVASNLQYNRTMQRLDSFIILF